MTIKPIGGFDLAAFKSDTHALVNSPITLKDLGVFAKAGLLRAAQQVSEWGQGTPARKREGRMRRILTDGRCMHPTKGISRSERGGYAKRSRRSNRT